MSKEREERIERLIKRLHSNDSLFDEEIMDTLGIIDNIGNVVNQKLSESNPSNELEMNDNISMIDTFSILKDLYLYIARNNVFVTKKTE